MYTIDLNCDMGEGFGAYSIGHDSEIMPYINSANIACGFHAGDAAIMKRTVELALEHNVAIGAHPGLPDLAGFGRREMVVTPDQAYEYVLYQIGALYGFVKASGGTLQHVKPHGALYNMAAKDRRLADAIAKAVYDLDPSLVLFGLSGSELTAAGKEIGLATASEVFADRTYQATGLLTPRSQSDALITSDDQAIGQVVNMIKHQTVQATDGQMIPIEADTVCIHGDGQHALSFARKIHETLRREEILLHHFQSRP